MNTRAEVTLRRAQLHDAAALAALAERTFRDTFAADNSDSDMDRYCRAHFGGALQRREIDDAGTLTLVAEAHYELVGYAQLHPLKRHLSVAARRPIELSRLYVQADWLGRGIGHRLLEAARAEARQRGCDVLWLGVWEHNLRAQAFYTQQGFEVVGEHPFLLGEDRQRDLVMSLGLAEAARSG